MKNKHTTYDKNECLEKEVDKEEEITKLPLSYNSEKLNELWNDHFERGNKKYYNNYDRIFKK